MKVGLVSLALVAAFAGSSAKAADVVLRARSQAAPVVAPVVSKIATQGIGYSAAQLVRRSPSGTHRVHVVCVPEETFATAYCPTVQHDAFCPSAKIVCR